MSSAFKLAFVATAVGALLALTPVSGQTPTVVDKKLDPVANARTASPTFRGLANQGRRLATYNIEEGADERHVLFSGNQTEPPQPGGGILPTASIPYQRWARSKATGHFRQLDTEIDERGVCGTAYALLSERCPPHVRSGDLLRLCSTLGYVSSCRSSTDGSRVVPDRRNVRMLEK